MLFRPPRSTPSRRPFSMGGPCKTSSRPVRGRLLTPSILGWLSALLSLVLVHKFAPTLFLDCLFTCMDRSAQRHYKHLDILPQAKDALAERGSIQRPSRNRLLT